MHTIHKMGGGAHKEFNPERDSKLLTDFASASTPERTTVTRVMLLDSKKHTNAKQPKMHVLSKMLKITSKHSRPHNRQVTSNAKIKSKFRKIRMEGLTETQS